MSAVTFRYGLLASGLPGGMAASSPCACPKKDQVSNEYNDADDQQKQQPLGDYANDAQDDGCDDDQQEQCYQGISYC